MRQNLKSPAKTGRLLDEGNKQTVSVKIDLNRGSVQFINKHPYTDDQDVVLYLDFKPWGAVYATHKSQGNFTCVK